jgi:hypothetical protein
MSDTDGARVGRARPRGSCCLEAEAAAPPTRSGDRRSWAHGACQQPGRRPSRHHRVRPSAPSQLRPQRPHLHRLLRGRGLARAVGDGEPHVVDARRAVAVGRRTGSGACPPSRRPSRSGTRRCARRRASRSLRRARRRPGRCGAGRRGGAPSAASSAPRSAKFRRPELRADRGARRRRRPVGDRRESAGRPGAPARPSHTRQLAERLPASGR